MYAVIDTETTGLLPSHRHRVIEVAVVLLDARGQVEREWVTLLNPQRDLGPQHIHGILTADVLDFCLLAAGRLSPTRLAHTFEGDAELASELIRAAPAFAAA